MAAANWVSGEWMPAGAGHQWKGPSTKGLVNSAKELRLYPKSTRKPSSGFSRGWHGQVCIPLTARCVCVCVCVYECGNVLASVDLRPLLRNFHGSPFCLSSRALRKQVCSLFSVRAFQTSVLFLLPNILITFFCTFNIINLPNKMWLIEWSTTLQKVLEKSRFVISLIWTLLEPHASPNVHIKFSVY